MVVVAVRRNGALLSLLYVEKFAVPKNRQALRSSFVSEKVGGLKELLSSGIYPQVIDAPPLCS